MARKTPAVAYYRMSTDKQETSIADQRVAVEDYAKKNGYRIIREYADEGVSGWKSTQRKSFQRMIDDAPTGNFRAVLVWDQDRFSRFAVREFMHYWHILGEADVDIVSVAQGKLDDKDFGWLTAGVTQHGKEQYCRDLSRNVCRGMREKRLQGEWLGPAPYGMRVADRRLVPGPAHEVRIVRMIFKLRLQGFGTHLIAKELNNQGFETANGKMWKSQTIAGILERPAYVGDSLIGRFSNGAFGKLTDEPLLIKDTHKGIVDRETWDRAQAIPRQKRLPAGQGAGGEARLRGLMTCGMCGGPMYQLKQPSGKHLYRCGNYSDSKRLKNGKKCVHCAVKRDPFESAVFDLIRKKLFLNKPDRIEAAIDRALRRRQVASSHRSEQEAIKREAGKLERDIKKATQRLLLIDPELLPTAQARVLEMKRKREALLDSMVTNKGDTLPTAKEVLGYLKEFDEVLRTGPAPTVRQAVQEIVSGIVCDFEFDEKRSTAKRKYHNFVGADVVFRTLESSTSVH